MPKAPGVNDDRDSKLVEAADCQEVVECVLEAFQNMTSVSSLIIWRSFVKQDLDVQIAHDVGYRHSQYSSRKKAAMIEFNYAFAGRLQKRGLHNDRFDFSEYL